MEIEALRSLLTRPHLSVIGLAEDPELARISARLEHKQFVGGRGGLEILLGALLECDAAPTPKTLDLIGHSTAGKALLVLGDWVIDVANPIVPAFFRGLADQEVLPKLGIHEIRLLGSMTADSRHGRATICALADILGIEVYGTRDLIFMAHFDAPGFSTERRNVLVSASELRGEAAELPGGTANDPHERVLDLDALPARVMSSHGSPWPLRTASRDDASAFLRLVRRRAGVTMPGLLTSPSCELALPSGLAGHYHRAQILFEGEFVRVYPDGPDRPGVVYPTVDGPALMALVARIPTAASYSS